MINLANQLFFTEKKNPVNKFIEAILEECDYCKGVMEKHFNENLAMSAEDDERFHLSNNCWICDKFFDVEDNKKRDKCQQISICLI